MQLKNYRVWCINNQKILDGDYVMLITGEEETQNRRKYKIIRRK